LAAKAELIVTSETSSEQKIDAILSLFCFLATRKLGRAQKWVGRRRGGANPTILKKNALASVKPPTSSHLFVVISQLNLELYLSQENRVEFPRRKLADICRAVGVEVVQNS